VQFANFANKQVTEKAKLLSYLQANSILKFNT